MRRFWVILAFGSILGAADDNRSLGDRTLQYLTELIRRDTSNPPGNETRVAEYLKQVADAHGIAAELIGSDPNRKNFVARLPGSQKGRPLLLMAHTDVVPADKSQWTADPFGAELHSGYIYGRGAQDDKSLLAAELAVMVEIKRRNIHLGRDVILLAEADEEAGSSGIQYLLQHAPTKIDAEFALNEGGAILELKDGTRIFEIQTAEKIPTRLTLTAKGVAGHGSIPRADNAIVHLAAAITRIAGWQQPVTLNTTTRHYLRDLSRLPDDSWLAPLVFRLENPGTAAAAELQIHAHDPEIDAMLHTTVSPTILRAGAKDNVIPGTAEAELDVRRMPSETREDVLARFRQIVADPEVEVSFAPGQVMPSTEPSSLSTPLYHAMDRAIARVYPHDNVVPYMSNGATDGSYLRAHGMAVYGVPIFDREGTESRAHANDERISPKNLEDGVELLWQMVMETAGPGQP